MFGYVIPNNNELKIREFEVYNSYYCAVCHSIRDRYGQLPRLLLSYDSVFLAMVLSAIDDEKDNIKQFRCIFNPVKKRNILESTEKIDYAADMMIILGYYKLKDDYEDEKKIIGLAGAAYLKRSMNIIRKKYIQKNEIICSYLHKLTEIEKCETHVFDEAAEPFSMLMEEIFDYKNSSFSNFNIIYKKIGFHIGKWIYLIDAFDDIEEDIKNNNYNPILKQFGFNCGDNEGESPEEFKRRINNRIRLNLELYLANIGEHINELPLKKNKGIIENIVYLGLRNKTDEVLNLNVDSKQEEAKK